MGRRQERLEVRNRLLDALAEAGIKIVPASVVDRAVNMVQAETAGRPWSLHHKRNGSVAIYLAVGDKDVEILRGQHAQATSYTTGEESQ